MDASYTGTLTSLTLRTLGQAHATPGIPAAPSPCLGCAAPRFCPLGLSIAALDERKGTETRPQDNLFKLPPPPLLLLLATLRQARRHRAWLAGSRADSLPSLLSTPLHSRRGPPGDRLARMPRLFARRGLPPSLSARHASRLFMLPPLQLSGGMALRRLGGTGTLARPGVP